jgi:signal transduction histidine kinase
MMCHTLSERLAGGDIASRRARLKKQAQQIGGLLREAITFTRSLSHGLSPVRMRIDGLEAALKGLALQTDQAGRVRCRFDCPVEVRVLDDHVAGHLYRIAQEALNNALKHGQPKEVVIRLARDKGSLRLQVKDDGAGLPQKRNPSQGMGLQVMQYRAHAIGAALSVESAPGKGVTVTCILPTEEHAP